MRLALCSLAAAAALSIGGAVNAATVIHFDDFSTDTLTPPNPTYNTSARTTPTRPTHAASPGVPQLDGAPNVTQVNGRAARVGNNNASAATLATSVGTFGAYATYEVSAYFRANVATTTGARGQMGGVGLSNFDNGFWTDNQRTPTAHSGFEVLVVGGTSVDTVDLRLRNINVGSIGTSTSPVSANPLLNQVWYKLDLTVTRQIGGTFDLSANLYQLDAGETGSRPGWYNPTLVLSHSVTGLTNVNFDATTPLYAGFGVRRAQSSGNDLTGFGAADDFKVVGIPEPSSLALLGLAGLLAVRRRRA